MISPDIEAQPRTRLLDQCLQTFDTTAVEVVYGLPGDQVAVRGAVHVDSSDTAFVDGVIVGRMTTTGLVASHLVASLEMSVFGSTRAACQADARYGEQVLSVLDPAIAWARSVRPAGNAFGYPTLDIETLDAKHVSVLWEVGIRGGSPYPNTVFSIDEYVLVKR